MLLSSCSYLRMHSIGSILRCCLESARYRLSNRAHLTHAARCICRVFQQTAVQLRVISGVVSSLSERAAAANWLTPAADVACLVKTSGHGGRAGQPARPCFNYSISVTSSWRRAPTQALSRHLIRHLGRWSLLYPIASYDPLFTDVPTVYAAAAAVVMVTASAAENRRPANEAALITFPQPTTEQQQRRKTHRKSLQSHRHQCDLSYWFFFHLQL